MTPGKEFTIQTLFPMVRLPRWHPGWANKHPETGSSLSQAHPGRLDRSCGEDQPPPPPEGILMLGRAAEGREVWTMMQPLTPGSSPANRHSMRPSQGFW